MGIIALTNAALPAYSGSNWLQLATGGNNAAGESVTITFPQDVYCLEFYINDIDTQFVSGSSRYRDDISVKAATAASAAVNVTATGNASYLVTSSGASNPATARTVNTATSTTPTTYEWNYQTSANGLAKFTATGPLRTVTITYTNTNAGGGTGVNDNNQQVWVSPLKYATVGCTC